MFNDIQELPVSEILKLQPDLNLSTCAFKAFRKHLNPIHGCVRPLAGIDMGIQRTPDHINPVQYYCPK